MYNLNRKKCSDKERRKMEKQLNFLINFLTRTARILIKDFLLNMLLTY